MLEYARWKYILVSIVLVLAFLFALPNVFGETRALQVARKDHNALDATAQQAIEKFLHAGWERRLDLVKRALKIGEEVGAGDPFHERAAVIQRTELGQRQGISRQRPHQNLGVEPPELRAVDDLVVDGKACGLQRLQVSPDGSGRHLEIGGQDGDRARAPGGELLEDRPLPNELGVSAHWCPAIAGC